MQPRTDRSKFGTEHGGPSDRVMIEFSRNKGCESEEGLAMIEARQRPFSWTSLMAPIGSALPLKGQSTLSPACIDPLGTAQF